MSTINRRKIISSLLNVFQLLYYFPFRYNRTYLSFQLSTTLYILLRAHVFDQPSISVHLLAWVFDMIGTALPKQTRNRDNRQPYTWKIQYTNPKPRKACIYWGVSDTYETNYPCCVPSLPDLFCFSLIYSVEENTKFTKAWKSLPSKHDILYFRNNLTFLLEFSEYLLLWCAINLGLLINI